MLLCGIAVAQLVVPTASGTAVLTYEESNTLWGAAPCGGNAFFPEDASYGCCDPAECGSGNRSADVKDKGNDATHTVECVYPDPENPEGEPLSCGSYTATHYVCKKGGG